MSAHVRSTRICSTAALLGLFALLHGCDDDLPRATEIVHMRVLGAQLEVANPTDGDATRATPKPGEKVRVTLPIGFPALEPEPNGDVLSLPRKQARVSSLIVACTAPDRYTGGIPICQELIDLAELAADVPPEDIPDDVPALLMPFRCDGSMSFSLGGPLSVNCTEGTPVVELTVPADYERERLLFSGIVCERGTPIARADQQEPFACCEPSDSDDPSECKEIERGEAIRVHGLIPVQQRKADVNHNPDIDALRIVREVNGAWNPVDPSLLTVMNETDCKRVADAQENKADFPLLYGHIDFTLKYDGKKRERFEGQPEQLEITLYTTHGEMERRFTLFDPQDNDLSSTLRYTPPKKDIPGGGQLVRFYASVRDQRGGFSLAEYALCLGQLVLPARR